MSWVEASNIDDRNYWTVCDNMSWFYSVLSTAPAGQRSELPTLNLAVRRRVCDSVGGMNERYVTGEDMEWTTRMRKAGYQLHFEPTAVVTHAAYRDSFRELWKRGYQYGSNSPKTNRPDASRHEWVTRQSLLSSWWMLLALSPLLATLAAGRVVVSRSSVRAWIAFPGVWLSKLAWCVGASHAVRMRRVAGSAPK